MAITVQPSPHTPPACDEDLVHAQRLRHDIRQSLTIVMSLAAIVDKSLGRGPEVLERLEQIRRETEWMRQLVSDTEPEPTRREVLDAGELVAEAWCSAAATCTCSIQLVRDARTRVLVDREMFGRSVRNLMDNAVRAAGPSGKVVVRVCAEPTEVAVVVHDDGPGFGKIPRQQGLGLATVHGFVQTHDGRLEVQKADGGGTQMTLRIPRVLIPTQRSGEAVRRCGS